MEWILSWRGHSGGLRERLSEAGLAELELPIYIGTPFPCPLFMG